jgi:hypothetical protein
MSWLARFTARARPKPNHGSNPCSVSWTAAKTALWMSHLEALRQSLEPLRADQQKALEQEIGYFTTHHHRMNYKQAKAPGEPVGSGVVESTARQYQTRFKCAGQYWTQAGDEALLALARLHRNERWHLLFPHSQPTNNQLKQQPRSVQPATGIG